MGRFEFLDHPGPIPFAHRGGAGEWPENTMPAFAGAVELGYRYLETDAHVTADGVVVAFHDDRLDRVTDRRGLIRELPWADVAAARVEGTERVPRLDELLRTWPEVRVNIDAKHDGVVEPLAHLVADLGAVDRVCLASFSGRRIARLRELLGPRLCTGAGPLAIVRARLASFGLPVADRRPGCLQVPVASGRIPIVDDRFVRRAHRDGLAVHVWTVDEPDEMVRLLDLGVDGLMTDRPAILRRVLEARGQWHGT